MTRGSSKLAILCSWLAAALALVQPGAAVADVLALEILHPGQQRDTSFPLEGTLWADLGILPVLCLGDGTLEVEILDAETSGAEVLGVLVALGVGVADWAVAVPRPRFLPRSAITDFSSSLPDTGPIPARSQLPAPSGSCSRTKPARAESPFTTPRNGTTVESCNSKTTATTTPTTKSP